MHLREGTVWLLALVSLFLPVSLNAQESESRAQRQPSQPAPAADQKSAAPRPVLNEQQRRGEALFVQNCPLCHIPSKQKKELGIQGPVLRGMYGDDADQDSLRQIIEQGLPGKMPGFRYDLDSKQIDDVIAFLKAGAYAKTPGVAN
jgi:mono/diheme cytochrome c family protein